MDFFPSAERGGEGETFGPAQNLKTFITCLGFPKRKLGHWERNP
jgi:hypothetical protein